MKNDSIESFVFFSRSGCILPLLIGFNLLFGWIFLKTKYWLIMEAVLILLFLLNAYVIRRKIIRGASRRDDAIDVEGKVIEDSSPRLK
jgi:hypothetical protein